jgi:hypothetical protein
MPEQSGFAFICTSNRVISSATFISGKLAAWKHAP